LQSITPYLEQKGVPIIGGVSGNSVEETSPMVFNPQAGPSIVPPASIASISAQLPAGQRNVAIFYCLESPQCSIIRNGMRQRAAEFGTTIVSEAQISLAQPDFTSQVAQARTAGANVLFVAADLNTLLRIARGAARQGYSGVLAGAFQYDLDEVKAYKTELDGLIGFSLTVNYDASPRLEDYRRAVARFVPGGGIGGLGAQAWTQGKLLEAIAPSLDDHVTATEIVQALLGLHDVDLGGLIPPITFKPGAHRDVNHCYIPTRFVGGRWTEPLGERFRCIDY
jgi:branched-chain amino acid transport system substrate-binding protein